MERANIFRRRSYQHCSWCGEDTKLTKTQQSNKPGTYQEEMVQLKLRSICKRATMTELQARWHDERGSAKIGKPNFFCILGSETGTGSPGVVFGSLDGTMQGSSDGKLECCSVGTAVGNVLGLRWQNSGLIRKTSGMPSCKDNVRCYARIEG